MSDINIDKYPESMLYVKSEGNIYTVYNKYMIKNADNKNSGIMEYKFSNVIMSTFPSINCHSDYRNGFMLSRNVKITTDEYTQERPIQTEYCNCDKAYHEELLTQIKSLNIKNDELRKEIQKLKDKYEPIEENEDDFDE